MVNGFMVVRLPRENYDAEGRGVFLSTPPGLGSVFYGGVDRMPWFDLDEEYYAGTLEREMLEFRDMLRRVNSDIWGLDVVHDLVTATRVLKSVNSNVARNELIAIRSSDLEEDKGTVSIEEGLVVWLGLDAVIPGHGSILAYVFRQPALFSDWVSKLNENGLLPSQYDVEAFAETYAAQAELGLVESVDRQWEGAHALEVGRVIVG